LQQSLGLSYVLIAHDLAVVRHVCDRIAVMYLGIIVEQGPTEAVFTKPMHPYTQALIACVPTGEPARRGRRPQLEGDVPSPVDVPSGCRFRTRCPLATERCAVEAPPMRAVGDGRTAACWALPVQ
jgi:oligopeptide/dipeptide ABC transporter ATP-binding protein